MGQIFLDNLLVCMHAKMLQRSIANIDQLLSNEVLIDLS